MLPPKYIYTQRTSLIYNVPTSISGGNYESHEIFQYGLLNGISDPSTKNHVEVILSHI